MSETIINFIKTELLNNDQAVDILPEDDLLGSGLVDSMGMMRLISFIEKSHQITVAPEDMTIENFMTVEDISAYIESKKS